MNSFKINYLTQKIHVKWLLSIGAVLLIYWPTNSEAYWPTSFANSPGYCMTIGVPCSQPVMNTCHFMCPPNYTNYVPQPRMPQYQMFSGSMCQAQTYMTGTPMYSAFPNYGHCSMNQFSQTPYSHCSSLGGSQHGCAGILLGKGIVRTIGKTGKGIFSFFTKSLGRSSGSHSKRGLKSHRRSSKNRSGSSGSSGDYFSRGSTSGGLSNRGLSNAQSSNSSNKVQNPTNTSSLKETSSQTETDTSTTQTPESTKNNPSNLSQQTAVIRTADTVNQPIQKSFSNYTPNGFTVCGLLEKAGDKRYLHINDPSQEAYTRNNISVYTLTQSPKHLDTGSDICLNLKITQQNTYGGHRATAKVLGVSERPRKTISQSKSIFKKVKDSFKTGDTNQNESSDDDGYFSKDSTSGGLAKGSSNSQSQNKAKNPTDTGVNLSEGTQKNKSIFKRIKDSLTTGNTNQNESSDDGYFSRGSTSGGLAKGLSDNQSQNKAKNPTDTGAVELSEGTTAKKISDNEQELATAKKPDKTEATLDCEDCEDIQKDVAETFEDITKAPIKCDANNYEAFKNSTQYEAITEGREGDYTQHKGLFQCIRQAHINSSNTQKTFQMCKDENSQLTQMDKPLCTDDLYTLRITQSFSNTALCLGLNPFDYFGAINQESQFHPFQYNTDGSTGVGQQYMKAGKNKDTALGFYGDFIQPDTFKKIKKELNNLLKNKNQTEVSNVVCEEIFSHFNLNELRSNIAKPCSLISDSEISPTRRAKNLDKSFLLSLLSFKRSENIINDKIQKLKTADNSDLKNCVNNHQVNTNLKDIVLAGYNMGPYSALKKFCSYLQFKDRGESFADYLNNEKSTSGYSYSHLKNLKKNLEKIENNNGRPQITCH